MNDPRHETGMRVRREVLGDAHVDQAVAAASPLTAPFQEFVTRAAWGDVWSRPGLDRRTRSCITLALLAALGRERELALHVRAALRNGLDASEIAEVLLHTAVYAGVPAANSAFAVAQRTLAELGVADALPTAGEGASGGGAPDGGSADSSPGAGGAANPGGSPPGAPDDPIR